MCGIGGKVYRNGQRQVESDLLRAMCGAMVHRGPDDEGVYLQDQVGLCMRRLQVIDLAGGHQPMSNEDASLCIVFNGEVYNYRDLRRDLEARGHIFRSNTDTEVVLHLYEEKGWECLYQLRGMFAFSIWDVDNKQLFMARDRLGQKPFYYALNTDGLTFGSEIGVVLQDPCVSRDLDMLAVDRYLSYLFVPSPHSIFREIRKLPPASYAIFAGGEMRIKTYWSVDYVEAGPRRSEEDYLAELEERLVESVRLRMISDVPLGAFLSGGLDSSLIVSLMCDMADQKVKTFSIGFEEASFNELDHARTVAHCLGTEHHEYVVDYQVQDLLPRFLEHFGEPFADSSALPLYHLSHMTRQDVTVALSGDGADEIFAGYRRYQARRMAEWYNCWPGWAGRGGFEQAVQRLPEPAVYYGRSKRKKLKRFVEYAAAVREKAETSWAFFFSEREKRALYSENFADILNREDRGEALFEVSHPVQDPVNYMLMVDLHTYLPDDILVKVDRMSMACSLEVRSPFLDHQLVEFMAAVPLHLKLAGRQRKYLLRKLAEKHLPASIVRRPKQGFAVPVAAWLRAELRDWARDILLSSSARERGFFKPEYVEEMFATHDGQRDLSQQLWALLVLEVWQQTVARST